MALGLMQKKNFAEDTGGGSKFKEGFVRVDDSQFAVVQPFIIEESKRKPGYKIPAPFIALAWDISRLDEDMQPMTDDDENPLTETILFKLGGKALGKVHPGKADSMNDAEIEDAGIAAGTKGPTLFFTDPTFRLHPSSGLAKLADSLAGKVPEEILDREWAPDYNGMVVFMKAVMSGKDNMFTGADGKDHEYAIKVADRVVRMGGGKKGATPIGSGKAAAASDAHEVVLTPILQAISSELDGEPAISFKALTNRVSKALQKGTVDAKLHIPILALIKDVDWLKKNAGKFDMTVNVPDSTVTFGEPKA